MKKYFFFVLASIALVSTGAYAQDATTQVAPNPNGPLMTFDVMEHNFGTIKQGEVATYEFKFKNTGKEPLVISEAHGSCGCTVPDWPKDPIAPGKTGIIKVTFNSTGKSGAIDKTVTINSNNRDGIVTLHMKGTVEIPASGTSTTAPSSGTPSTTTPATSGTSTTTTAPQKDPAASPAPPKDKPKTSKPKSAADKPKQ
jgi:hypothetical protein